MSEKSLLARAETCAILYDDGQDRTIDTAPLQRVIDMFAAMSAAILEGVLDKAALARLKKCASEIERVSKELRRTSLSNMKASALARLRSDRAYRARVCRELGGYHVIARWREKLRASNFPRQIELRAARADALQDMKTNPDAGFKRDVGAADLGGKGVVPLRERRAVKTCGAGLFRLAPVPIWLESSSVRPRPEGKQGARNARSGAVRRLYAPIPLMPEDIGPDDLEDLPEVSEDARDEFSNFENITPQEMQDWIWNEAEEDFYPPVIEPHPPPKISRPRAPHIRRL